MNKFITAALASLIATIGVTSCRPTASNGDVSRTKQEEKQLNAPAKFNRDSAYSYVRRQVTFGPRVAGTEENRKCREYIVNELQRHGAQNVNVQTGKVRAFNDDEFLIGNIMGSYRPELKDRILLVAHYDTRPWCDSDNNEENRLKPVIGANDGASGVATILEIARNLNAKEAPIGVDILFVDAEDYGQASGFSSHDSSWCLGTQYWIENIPYNADSLPRYAVLLDMVGGIGAKFHREYFSDKYARALVDRVWSTAARSGYEDRFINKSGGSVVDDHLFLNEAGIPAIDIIESKNDATGTFPATWHTINDTLDNIDPSSLEAAGQTVLNLIYNEKSYPG
ncbi:MAG: M28 family peptidase [Duncaniella sp.]|nr:M28 family peptidase [Bacteroides sp.]MBD5353646.1 M28 family peptidase [Bacteroides sp.]MDE5826094.1 M28 family peptidase [Duncaniella sp.]MDE6824244.1 M28 family peptidase [Duncaniella sp.]MDE7474334.1 M28 family peptidase [Duncaniella sp.]